MFHNLNFFLNKCFRTFQSVPECSGARVNDIIRLEERNFSLIFRTEAAHRPSRFGELIRQNIGQIFTESWIISVAVSPASLDLFRSVKIEFRNWFLSFWRLVNIQRPLVDSSSDICRRTLMNTRTDHCGGIFFCLQQFFSCSAKKKKKTRRFLFFSLAPQSAESLGTFLCFTREKLNAVRLLSFFFLFFLVFF